MKAWIGKSIIAISIVHILFGLFFAGDTLAVLFAEGLVNTVDGQPAREAVFWFLMAGFILFILGYVIDWLEKLGRGIPPYLLWLISGITLVAAIIMPVSGIWLFIIPITGLTFRKKI